MAGLEGVATTTLLGTAALVVAGVGEVQLVPVRNDVMA
jgi:hypothetical protein